MCFFGFVLVWLGEGVVVMVRVSRVLTKSFGGGCVGYVSNPLAGRPAGRPFMECKFQKSNSIKECKVGVCEVVEEVEKY